MHTSASKHFSRRLLDYKAAKQKQKYKKGSRPGSSSLRRRAEDDQTSATSKPQGVFKKEKKVADIEVHEKGTWTALLIISTAGL